MMAEVDLCYNNSVNAMRMVCLDEAVIWGFFCWGRFLAHRASSGRRGASLVVRLKPQRPITYCYGSRPRPRIRHAAPFARRSYTASLSFLDDRWERVDSSSSLRQQHLCEASPKSYHLRRYVDDNLKLIKTLLMRKPVWFIRLMRYAFVS